MTNTITTSINPTRCLYTKRGIEPINDFQLCTLNLENKQLTLAVEILDNATKNKQFVGEKNNIIKGLINFFENKRDHENLNPTLREIHRIVFNQEDKLLKNVGYRENNDNWQIKSNRNNGFELTKTEKFIIATLLFKMFLHENIETLTSNYKKGDNNLMQNPREGFRAFLENNIRNPSQVRAAKDIAADIKISDIIHIAELFNSKGEFNYMFRKENNKLLIYYKGSIPDTEKSDSWLCAKPIKQVILAIPLTDENILAIPLTDENIHSIIPLGITSQYEAEFPPRPPLDWSHKLSYDHFYNSLPITTASIDVDEQSQESVWYKPWTWSRVYFAGVWQNLTDFCWESKTDLDGSGLQNISEVPSQVVTPEYPPQNLVETVEGVLEKDELEEGDLELITELMKNSYSAIMDQITKSNSKDDKCEAIKIKIFMTTILQYRDKCSSPSSKSMDNIRKLVYDILNSIYIYIEKEYKNKMEFKHEVVGYLNILVLVIFYCNNQNFLRIYAKNALDACEVLEGYCQIAGSQNNLMELRTLHQAASPGQGRNYNFDDKVR